MDERQWNPRFLQYARWRGMTPEEALESDSGAFPGGRMAGFVLWSDARIQEWCRISGVDRHYAGLHNREIGEHIEKLLARREQHEDKETAGRPEGDEP
jgi:hypothetical protein